MSKLYIPTYDTFSSTTNPANFEPYAQACTFLATEFSIDLSLIPKHWEILQEVTFSEPPIPQTTFVPAVPGANNTGVIQKTGPLTQHTTCMLITASLWTSKIICWLLWLLVLRLFIRPQGIQTWVSGRTVWVWTSSISLSALTRESGPERKITPGPKKNPFCLKKIQKLSGKLCHWRKES